MLMTTIVLQPLSELVVIVDKSLLRKEQFAVVGILFIWSIIFPTYFYFMSIQYSIIFVVIHLFKCFFSQWMKRRWEKLLRIPLVLLMFPNLFVGLVHWQKLKMGKYINLIMLYILHYVLFTENIFTITFILYFPFYLFIYFHLGLTSGLLHLL